MTIPQETYGNFRSEAGPMELQVSISILPSDLNGYLNRCGMTADYGAAFLSASLSQGGSARNSLSFILNELVENAVKFSNSRDEKIDVELSHCGDEIIFSVINCINESQYFFLKKYIEEYIETSDTNGKYFELLASMSEHTHISRIGLLTIMNNFNARIGFRITGPSDRGLYHACVQITVRQGEII